MKYTVEPWGNGPSVEFEHVTVSDKGPRLITQSGPVLIPNLAMGFGGGPAGIIAALFLQQLHFKLRILSAAKLADIEAHGFNTRFVAVSNVEWLHEFPFLSEKTVRRAFCKLKDAGWVHSDCGVATYESPKHISTKRTTFWAINDPIYDLDSPTKLPKLVTPGKFAIPTSRALVNSTGLTESLVLQQTHYYSRKGPIFDNHHWLVKTFDQWHTDLLPCVSVRSLKKAIGNLELSGLIVSRNKVCSDDRVKAYRVAYDAVKKVVVSSG